MVLQGVAYPIPLGGTVSVKRVAVVTMGFDLIMLIAPCCVSYTITNKQVL